jgi:hypothetical protein
VGAKRIVAPRDREGFGRAVVDGNVVIDVMHAVWNHDVAVQRLERLGARSPERRPGGYMLVVDAVAEAAHKRIDQAASQAPFAAVLAVWRADQHPRDLAEAFDVLHGQLEPPPSE